ncbi:MAG: GNAT family N-acetyltransferase [Euryarchaeota archaeon]|nr:GNAT family N-acetyltransferase [Euryarchaeota archaeon]
MTIRPARPDDAAGIARVYNEGIEERMATFETEPRSEKYTREWIENNPERFPILVAELDGRVVAWAAVQEYRARECYRGIGEYSIYVGSDARGRGVGKALMEALIDAARNKGFWKILSRVFPQNMASRSLCARTGFREVGVYKKHAELDGVWRDVIIVERLIEENMD